MRTKSNTVHLTSKLTFKVKNHKNYNDVKVVHYSMDTKTAGG